MSIQEHRAVKVCVMPRTISANCSCGGWGELFLLKETARERFQAHVEHHAAVDHRAASGGESVGEAWAVCACGKGFGWSFTPVNTRIHTHRLDVVREAMQSWDEATKQPTKEKENIMGMADGPAYKIDRRIELSITLTLPVNAGVIAEAASLLRRDYRGTVAEESMGVTPAPEVLLDHGPEGDIVLRVVAEL